MRDWLFLMCSQCGMRYYRTSKNNKTSGKLEMKKFCRGCREHTVHREKKK